MKVEPFNLPIVLLALSRRLAGLPRVDGFLLFLAK
jgi:hypothetical protein